MRSLLCTTTLHSLRVRLSQHPPRRCPASSPTTSPQHTPPAAGSAFGVLSARAGSKYWGNGATMFTDTSRNVKWRRYVPATDPSLHSPAPMDGIDPGSCHRRRDTTQVSPCMRPIHLHLPPKCPAGASTPLITNCRPSVRVRSSSAGTLHQPSSLRVNSCTVNLPGQSCSQLCSEQKVRTNFPPSAGSRVNARHCVCSSLEPANIAERTCSPAAYCGRTRRSDGLFFLSLFQLHSWLPYGYYTVRDVLPPAIASLLCESSRDLPPSPKLVSKSQSCS